MKKKIIVFTVVLSTPIFIYTLCWLWLLFSASHQLNNQLANKNINFSSTNQAHYVKFQKIIPSGFPFKIAFKVIGWTEENNIGKLICVDPIYVGYDILKQELYGRYDGEITALYKPLELKFGSRIITKDYIFSLKLPLKKRLFELLANSDLDKFAVFNYAQDLQLTIGKTKIYDLINDEKFYDQDFRAFKISFIKRKNYTSLEDFVSNIPNEVNIIIDNKIQQSTFEKKLIPSNFLFAFNIPFILNGRTDIKVKFNQPLLANIPKDLEFNMIYSGIYAPTLEQQNRTTIFYKGQILDKEKKSDVRLLVNSTFTLEKGVFDKIFKSLKYLTTIRKNETFMEILRENKSMQMIIGGYIDRLDNPHSRQLEGRKYRFDLDLKLSSDPKATTLAVNDLGLFSNNTGLRVQGKNTLDMNAIWNIKGLSTINNYSLLIDLIVKKDMLGIMRNFSADACNIYAAATTNFLKSVSDYPNSDSQDLSFEYNASSQDFNNAKIGSTEFKNLGALYNFALYKKVIETIKPGEDVAQRIKELLPSLDQKKIDILQQLIGQPANIDTQMWNEIIKN